MEMKEINKIVQLSDLQYEKLLKDRQIEIDGEIKLWEPDTLYVTPNNNYQWLFNKFYETAVKPNEVYHTPMNMKSLEQEYEDLIIDSDTLANISAIGYTAILKNGDIIKVTEPNKGVFYINGAEVANDYTYTGDGYEVVNVWVFEGKYELALNDEPTFNIPELDVRNIATTPVVGNGYKKYASTIRAYNFTISGSVTRKLVSNGTESFNQSSIASTIEEVESDCTTIAIFRAGMYNKGNLKKVVFNNLTQIASEQGNFVCECTNPDLEIIFPNIKTINGNGNIALFSKVCNVVIPKSAVRLTSRICSSNQTITLNCNKAIIDNIWCGSTPTVNFTMCEDWQASINIATAAKNHTIDWFIDLFTNKLADMTGQDAPQINIPLAIFEALSPEQLAIARNKNWTVTGS